jgi:hypothetical protein
VFFVKHFITPQSVERAIQEELAKARELGVLPNLSEPVIEEKVEEPRAQRSAPSSQPEAVLEDTQAKLRELELENRDLLITSCSDLQSSAAGIAIIGVACAR